MIDYAPLLKQLAATSLAHWVEPLRATLQNKLEAPHGDLERWLNVLGQLPPAPAKHIDLCVDAIKIGSPDEVGNEQQRALRDALMGLHPWRKGPFDIFGIRIDTEWRSDWKWQRLEPHISSLRDRTVLDVGCGSGYHCWRMRGAGARFVLGIEPMWLYNVQFLLMQTLTGDLNVQMLPLTLEELPPAAPEFDTVFSLGVLYHRRSPLDHIATLINLLKPGGEMVLETLVVEGDDSTVLVPADRYAKMRNVWFLPSCAMLLRWLNRLGLRDARCVDVTRTTVEEQRRTDWMRFESLADFLDPADGSMTVEGLPAPVRATFIANKA